MLPSHPGLADTCSQQDLFCKEWVGGSGNLDCSCYRSSATKANVRRDQDDGNTCKAPKHIEWAKSKSKRLPEREEVSAAFTPSGCSSYDASHGCIILLNI